MRPSGAPGPAATAALPAGAEEVAFDIRNFNLWYGQRQALDDVGALRDKVRAIIEDAHTRLLRELEGGEPA